MDPTVHLSKRPTWAGIKPELSLPPFLVAGESIDGIAALSNREGKHLVQFLKFPYPETTQVCSPSMRAAQMPAKTGLFHRIRAVGAGLATQ